MPGCLSHQGFLSYFDGAENAFVSAYRKYKDTLKFDIHIEYIASPRIDGKTLIITDPMLATGSSMELSYQAMLTKGHPAEIHVASIIASRQAVEHIAETLPEDKLMGALHKAGIEINRKVLADLAMNHPEAFKAIVAKAKAA